MENFITTIYKKFLYSDVTRDEFLEMKYALNNSSGSELADLLQEEWNENIVTEEMNVQSKEDIRSKLDFYIESDKKRKNKKRILPAVAAFVPLLIVLGAFLIVSQFPANAPVNFAVAVERGNKALITLPDQSKVWLNSNSVIEYEKGENNIRNVNLNGEAFFKVAKNDAQPFVVTMNDLHIEVLGTSFNAKSRANSDIIETSLVEGSIKISGQDLPHDYYLKPNEKAIYSQSAKRIQIMQTDNDLETAWKDNKLKFSSERFIDVMAMLEDWYGITIVCNCPDIENDLISGTFKDENLETTLEALRMQYNIRYTRNKETITITTN